VSSCVERSAAITNISILLAYAADPLGMVSARKHEAAGAGVRLVPTGSGGGDTQQESSQQLCGSSQI
jgi:hypothetical protein